MSLIEEKDKKKKKKKKDFEVDPSADHPVHEEYTEMGPVMEG